MENSHKFVMVINPDLPLGLIANTAAVLAVSVGHKFGEIVGEDVLDQAGQIHAGITRSTITILKGEPGLIRALREKLVEKAQQDLYYVDFCDVAQKSKLYEQYQADLHNTPAEDLAYLGIALYGPTKAVNQLTGSIGLLR
jgi:hypothetical protein